MARDQRERGNSRSTMDYYEYKKMRELRRMQSATNVDNPTVRQNVNRTPEPEPTEPQTPQKKTVDKLLGGIKDAISGAPQRASKEKYEDEPFNMDEPIIPEEQKLEDGMWEAGEEEEQAAAPFASAMNMARKLGGGIKNLASKARTIKPRDDGQDDEEYTEYEEEARQEHIQKVERKVEAPEQNEIPKEHIPYARPVKEKQEQSLTPEQKKIQKPVDQEAELSLNSEETAQEPEGVFSLEDEAEQQADNPLEGLRENPVVKKIGGFFKFLAKGELEDDESEDDESEDVEEDEEEEDEETESGEQGVSAAPGRFNRWMEKMKRKSELRAQEEDGDWMDDQPSDQDDDAEFEDLVMDDTPVVQSIQPKEAPVEKETSVEEETRIRQAEASDEIPQGEPVEDSEQDDQAQTDIKTEEEEEVVPGQQEAAIQTDEETDREAPEAKKRRTVYGEEPDSEPQSRMESEEIRAWNDDGEDFDDDDEDEDDEEGEPFNPFGWIKSKLSSNKKERPESRTVQNDEADDEDFEEDIDFGAPADVSPSVQSTAARGSRFVTESGTVQGMEQPEKVKRAPGGRQNEGGDQMEGKNKKPSMTELLAADLDDQPVMSRRARRQHAAEEEADHADVTQPVEENEFPVDEPTVEFKLIRNRAPEAEPSKPAPRKKRPPRVVEIEDEEDEEEEEIQEKRKPARRPAPAKQPVKPQPKKRRVYSDEDYDDEYDDYDDDDYDDDDYDDYDDDDRGGFGKSFLGFLKVLIVIVLILALSVLALQQLEANGRVNLNWLRNTVGAVLPVEKVFPAPVQPTAEPTVEPTVEPAAETVTQAPQVTTPPAEQQQQPSAEQPAGDTTNQTDGQTDAQTDGQPAAQ